MRHFEKYKEYLRLKSEPIVFSKYFKIRYIGKNRGENFEKLALKMALILVTASTPGKIKNKIHKTEIRVKTQLK